MRYVGLVIDADVRKDMSMDQIMAMEIKAKLKAIGYPDARVRVLRQEVSKEDFIEQCRRDMPL